MSIPYQPQNMTAEQADGNVFLKWDAVLGATSYSTQISTDGINWSTFVSGISVPNYLVNTIGTLQYGAQYWFQVAAVNGSGTSPYSTAATCVPAPPSEMSLYEMRLRSQQTADRVGSQFVSTSEWNAFIRLAMYELYDLLIGVYEDYNATSMVTITTNGSQQWYPLPDGLTNYPNGTLDNNAYLSFGTVSNTSVTQGDVYQNGNFFYTIRQTLSNTTSFTASSIGTPPPNGILSPVSSSGSPIYYANYSINTTQQPAPAFYKEVGIDLAVNTSTVNPAWVTLKKYNFIDRNKYVYPNSTSTIYGVYNQAYRIMGQQIEFIPVPAGNQTIRMRYTPRLPSLLLDSDLTTIGFSGWLRYPIVRAAKYALDKEEGSDTSKLDAELLFLKQRITEMASNRDIGMPDTISETRRDGIYGGTGWGNGSGGSNGGW